MGCLVPVQSNFSYLVLLMVSVPVHITASVLHGSITLESMQIK